MKISFLTIVLIINSAIFAFQSYAFNLSEFLDELDKRAEETKKTNNGFNQTRKVIDEPVERKSSNKFNRIVLKNIGKSKAIGEHGIEFKNSLQETVEPFDKNFTKIDRLSLKDFKLLQTIEYEKEKIIGSKLAIQVFNRFGGSYTEPNLLKYVNLVGQTIARMSDRSDIDYYFGIVNSKSPVAFAVPGGYVFVSIGLLSVIQNEAQLAGVLGHEIAHIAHKHVLGSVLRKKKFQDIGAFSMSALEENSGQFSQLIDQVSELLFTNGLDKKIEFEADRMSLKYVARAGYYPSGLKDFLRIFGNSEKLKSSIILNTHPSARKRYRLLVKQLTGYKDSRNNPLLADRFKKMTENLL